MKKSLLKGGLLLASTFLLVACGEAADNNADSTTEESTEQVDEVRPDDDLTDEEKALIGAE